MDKLNVINRYLIDHDAFIFDGLSLVNDRSWFVKFFPSFTKYEGSIRRMKYSILLNGKMHCTESLIVCHFIDGVVHSFTLVIENGMLRLSDSIHNVNFEDKINILFNMICKFNTYNEAGYAKLSNELKAYGARRAAPAKKRKAKRASKPSYTVKPIKRK